MKRYSLYIRIAAALLCCVLSLSGCLRYQSTADLTASAVTEPALSAAAPTFETPTTLPAPTTSAPETTSAPGPAAEPQDTMAPFFLYFVHNVTLEQGNAFNVHKYVSYIDDLDPEVQLYVEGVVDPATLGEYPLKLTIVDNTGKYATANMTVTVTEPAPAPVEEPKDPPKSFDKFIRLYKKDGTMVGIDVSRWQENIDFQKVAAAGCEFAIMRIGGHIGENFVDRYYAANIRNAKAAGLKVGVYWYSEENGAEAVHRNAAFLYSLLNGETLDFPVFFDWEDYNNIEDYKMSLKDFGDMFSAFRQEAEAHGYKAALYNSKYYLELLWSEEVTGSVWLAHYTDETDYKGRYFLWQQGFARIDGINGDVDVDVLYPALMP